MRAPPTGWRAILTYTLFDLRNLARNKSVWQFFLMPLMFVPALAGQVWVTLDRPAASHAVVVTTDAATAEAVTADLRSDRWTVDIVAAPPPDLDQQLAAGDVQVAITLDPDFAANGRAQLRTGKDTPTRTGTNLHVAMIEALIAEHVLARGGPAPEVQYPHTPPPPAAGPSVSGRIVQDLATSSAPAHGLGLWAIGFFGLGIGAALGAALTKSLRERFNFVLAIGTPAHDIYRSELLTMSITQGAQSMAWWAMYAVAGLLAGRWLGMELPTHETVLQGLPLIIVLAPAALIQMTGLSMLVARAMEDAPSEVQRNLGFAMMLPVFALSSLADGVALHTLAAASAMPVLGPVALWSYRISATTSVIPAPLPWQALLLVQLGWTALALRLGAWVFVLDETPLTWAKRRWRRT